MKSYELTYLISPEIPQEEVRQFPEKITELLQKKGAVLIGTVATPVLKELGQPIKQRVGSQKQQKVKRNSCYLSTVNFQMESEKLNKLTEEICQIPKILRITLLHKREGKRPTKPGFALKGKRIIRRKPEKKVELKEIEKKLEEILGE